jgi:hypothetical protein
MMITSKHTARALAEELDLTVTALTKLDIEALDVLERRISLITVSHLTASRESLPELLKKQVLLRELLDATAANLKVLVSVLSLEPRSETR